MGSPTDVIGVVGMHRSSTSVIARSLEVLGADLGDRIGGPEPHNRRGSFEDRDINRLNEAMLRLMRSEWYDLSGLAPGSFSGEALAPCRVLADELLRDRTVCGRPFAFKDPRLCRTLPFWREAFERLQLRYRLVLVVRNPLSVAESLVKRNGFSREAGYWLWLEYNHAALTAMTAGDWTAVAYERMLYDPAGALARLGARLNLPLDAPYPARLQEFQSSFLAAELCHNGSDLDALRADPAAPVEAVELYRALRALAADDAASGARLRNVLPRVEARLRWARPALKRIDATLTARKAKSAWFRHVADGGLPPFWRGALAAPLTGLRRSLRARAARGFLDAWRPTPASTGARPVAQPAT